MSAVGLLVGKLGEVMTERRFGDIDVRIYGGPRWLYGFVLEYMVSLYGLYGIWQRRVGENRKVQGGNGLASTTSL